MAVVKSTVCTFIYVSTGNTIATEPTVTGANKRSVIVCTGSIDVTIVCICGTLINI